MGNDNHQGTHGARLLPSLSKTAMRSGTGTKSGEPGVVAFSTKDRARGAGL